MLRRQSAVGLGMVSALGLSQSSQLWAGKTADNASIYVRVEGRSKLQTSCPCRSWYSMGTHPAWTPGNKRRRESLTLKVSFYSVIMKTLVPSTAVGGHCEQLSICELLVEKARVPGRSI